jgi:hypothetical protein
MVHAAAGSILAHVIIRSISKSLATFYRVFSPRAQLQLTSSSAQKFVWGCMADFQKKIAVTPAPQPAALLATLSMMFIKTCLTQFETLPVGNRWKLELCIVFLSKIAVPGRKSQIADRKIADKLYCKSYENFQSPGFPHNFSPNYPRNPNMHCIDASRRQLQSVIKIRV